MLILANTTDKIQVTTGQAGALDVHASYADVLASAVTSGRQNTSISSAATTDVLAAPAASTTRTMQTFVARLRSGQVDTDVTVLYNQNGTTFQLFSAKLSSADVLQYTEDTGWFVSRNVDNINLAGSVADQTINAANALITGSAINVPLSRPAKIGTTFKWQIMASKTGAGTATPIFTVLFGTTGSATDTARLTFTGAAQTGVIDVADIDIWVTVRGPIGASAVVQGQLSLHHNLSATGFSTTAHDTVNAVSAAFDITAATFVSIAVNPGTLGVWTITQVIPEAMYI